MEDERRTIPFRCFEIHRPTYPNPGPFPIEPAGDFCVIGPVPTPPWRFRPHRHKSRRSFSAPTSRSRREIDAPRRRAPSKSRCRKPRITEKAKMTRARRVVIVRQPMLRTVPGIERDSEARSCRWGAPSRDSRRRHLRFSPHPCGLSRRGLSRQQNAIGDIVYPLAPLGVRATGLRSLGRMPRGNAQAKPWRTKAMWLMYRTNALRAGLQ